MPALSERLNTPISTGELQRRWRAVRTAMQAQRIDVLSTKAWTDAVLAQAGLQAREVSVMGITNQRETTVIWDKSTGAPLSNAIVWQDRRTAPLCDALRAEGNSDLVRSKTGLVIDGYFSGTKLRWLLDHVPGARARAGPPRCRGA